VRFLKSLKKELSRFQRMFPFSFIRTIFVVVQFSRIIC